MAEDPVFVCTDCNDSFGRREHLARHRLRHSGARPHRCPVCGKGFPRRDTLKRHVAMHGDAGLEEYHQAHPRALACRHCARSKQRCDGADPCQSCRERGRDCVYLRTPPASNNSRDSQPDHPTAPETAESRPFDQPGPGSVDCGTDLGVEGVAADAAWDDFLLASQSRPSNFPFAPFPMDASFAEPWMADDLGGASFLDPFHGDFGQTPAPTTSLAPGSLPDEPEIDQDEEDALESEHIHHVPMLEIETYEHIRHFMRRTLQPGTTAATSMATCLSRRHLDVYVQLYFEHFHPRLPFLHKPTFNPGKINWLLILSVAAIGSQFSKCAMQTYHYDIFQQTAWGALRMDRHELHDVTPLSYAQSLLVLQHCLMFNGSRKSFFHVNRYRNNLSTICRQFSRTKGSLFFRELDEEPQSTPWEHWTQAEAIRRLVYFTLATECMYTAFFEIPPLTDAGEISMGLPQAEALWQAQTAQEWQSLRATSTRERSLNTPPLCQAIGVGGINHSRLESLDQSALLIVALWCFAEVVRHDRFVRMASASNEIAVRPAQSDIISMTSPFRTKLNDLMAACLSQSEAKRSLSTILEIHKDLTTVFSISSFAPVGLLNVSSGWQTTTAGVTEARRQLSLQMGRDTRATKENLIKAALLFGKMRAAPAIAHFEPLCFLFATLYIWAYISITHSRLESGALAAHKDTEIEVLRLDYHPSDSRLQDWTTDKIKAAPHIAGIGRLSDSRGLVRLQKECARVFAGSGKRSKLAAGLAAIMTSAASGKSPGWDAVESQQEAD